MDYTRKKKLVEILRRIAKSVENGMCDSMDVSEYDILIDSLRNLQQLEVKYNIKPKKSWIFSK